MAQSTAQIVCNMLEAHYLKSKDGYYGGNPRPGALKLMEGGLLQDYLNENMSSGLVKEFDSALTWATPTNCRDRLLILNCAATADILPDDEPDHLDWRSVKLKEATETIHLTKPPSTTGFGFSLVTIDRNIYVRRVQPFSVAQGCGKLREGDRVLTVNGSSVGASHGLTQNNVIKLLKSEVEIDVYVAHVMFDGKGCPETTYDRSSPIQSPALENSYRLALDLSTSTPSTISNTSYEDREHLTHNGLSTTGCGSVVRGNVRADKHTHKHTDKYTSVGSVGDSVSTGSLEAGMLSGSSSGESGPDTRSSGPDTRSSPRSYNHSILSSRSSHGSSVNKDYYRDSLESLPAVSGTAGSTEYVVLPNHGRGVGIGISGKCGVIIRNILPGSIADKDGRLQIGDHILQVNDIKCAQFGKEDTKNIIIPTLRSSSPSVRLIVQHVCRKYSTSLHSHPTPTKTGPGATLPPHRQLDQGPDLLLPEAMWSDAHPAAPVAYRFGTVIIPAPQWIRWKQDTHFVTLTRLANGFGFSIMDYKEPKHKSEDTNSVLIIRQITPFGAADLEGHLALGERILAINKEPITDHSIEDIVSIIKPCSVLQLKMCKSIESEDWRSLLTTNISTVPLVSGPKTHAHSSQESVSTLNVRRYSDKLLSSTSSLETSSSTGTHRTTSLPGNHTTLPGNARARRGSGSMPDTNPPPRHHGSGSCISDTSAGSLRRYQPSSHHPTEHSQHSRQSSADENTRYQEHHSDRQYSRQYPYRTAENSNPPRNQVHSNHGNSEHVVHSNHGNSEHVVHNTRYPEDGGRQVNKSMTYNGSGRTNGGGGGSGRTNGGGSGRTKVIDYKNRSVSGARSHILSEAPQGYETTFGIRHVNPRNVSSAGSNCDVESIISTVSLNNHQLTELWKRRGADAGKHRNEQLSRV